MKVKSTFLLISVCTLILSGCMTNTGTYYKTSTKPYTVNGQTYYPMASASGFSEKGEASWYGPGFQGKKTASGETYNQNAFTAAHKTLPFGTRVKVTNLNNNASTTVVINDRGPFKKGRIIDVSRAAAKQLGMIGTGTARVRINSIGSVNTSAVTSTSVSGGSTTTSSSGTSGTYYVQTGAFSSRSNAETAANKLSAQGYKRRVVLNDSGTYVVQAGPYSSRADAESARDTLQKTYSGAFISR